MSPWSHLYSEDASLLPAHKSRDQEDTRPRGELAFRRTHRATKASSDITVAPTHSSQAFLLIFFLSCKTNSGMEGLGHTPGRFSPALIMGSIVNVCPAFITPTALFSGGGFEIE